MVAEELVRGPSLFAPENISAPALVGAYLDLLRECESDVPREDGSVSGKDGAVTFEDVRTEKTDITTKVILSKNHGDEG